MLKLIWAQSPSGIIGKNNKLPWNIKEEMQHFVRETKNKTIVMGRKTWESIDSKPLPNRINVIVTKQNLKIEDNSVLVINDFEKYLLDNKNNPDDICIIGGLEIFNISINFVDVLIVSEIKKEYDGDVYAPKIDSNNFELFESIDFDEFVVKKYRRIN